MHGESSRGSTDNRYAVSPAVATQADSASAGGFNPYAGFWRRAFAYLIDYIILFIVTRALRMVLGVPAMGSIASLFLIASSIGNCLYYALLESSSLQATLGKRALGIKVTDEQGERIGFGRALGRFLGQILSALILCLGFAMAAFTERRQALHDKMAGTLVVYAAESAEAIDQAGPAPRVAGWQIAVIVVAFLLGGPFGIGIIAAISIPAYQDYTIRAQITEGLNIAAPYRAAVESAVAGGATLGSIDSSTLSVSLPESAKYVDSVRVANGAIDIRYGRTANKKITGGHLILAPGMTGATRVQWFCGHANPPPGVTVSVADFQRYTSVPDRYLPRSCKTL